MRHVTHINASWHIHALRASLIRMSPVAHHEWGTTQMWMSHGTCAHGLCHECEVSHSNIYYGTRMHGRLIKASWPHTMNLWLNLRQHAHECWHDARGCYTHGAYCHAASTTRQRVCTASQHVYEFMTARTWVQGLLHAWRIVLCRINMCYCRVCALRYGTLSDSWQHAHACWLHSASSRINMCYAASTTQHVLCRINNTAVRAHCVTAHWRMHWQHAHECRGCCTHGISYYVASTTWQCARHTRSCSLDRIPRCVFHGTTHEWVRPVCLLCVLCVFSASSASRYSNQCVWYIHIHIYIYTYIHIYTYTHIHIYIYTSDSNRMSASSVSCARFLSLRCVCWDTHTNESRATYPDSFVCRHM